MSKCEYVDCLKPSRAAGLCWAHYSLERRERAKAETGVGYSKTDKDALWAFVKNELGIKEGK